MLLANDAPNATSKPIMTSVVGSVMLRISAKFEAMKRFGGPAKGMRLKPNDVSKTTSSSMMDAMRVVSVYVKSKVITIYKFRCNCF